MSENTQRTIPFSEIAGLLPRGGDFIQENRYSPDPEATFVPWGRKSFKPAPPKQSRGQPATETTAPEDAPAAQAEDAAEPTLSTSGDDAGPTTTPTEDTTKKKPAAAVGSRPITAAPKPPPPPEPAGPSPEDIIAAIEQAREDGRALGYQQGVDATRREIGATLSTLRKIESQITMLAHDALERNADIMAHHVRRIAQDLFGAVFDEIPGVFLERIKNAAEMFTKAGADFTLALNPHDAMTLSALMQENEIFEKIKIVEDDKLRSGAFHLSSRDLDYEDAPLLSDARGK
jgi:hypothetical protein